MFDEGKVGVFESICLMTITITSKVFFLNTSKISQLSGTAAWMQTIVTGITVLLLFFITCKLMERFDGYNLIEILQCTYGTIVSKILLIGVSIYFIIYASFLLREFIDMLKSFILPMTPISITLITFLLSILLIGYKGLESLTRVASFFSFFIILIFIAIVFLPLYNFKVYRLFPLFGHGIYNTTINGIIYCSSYSEIIALPVLIKSFQGTKYFKKIGYWAVFLSTLVFLLASLSYSLVLPYSLTPSPISALYTVAKTIDYGRFFQRFESLFIIGWVISSLINLGFALYFLSYNFAKIAKLSDNKPLFLPLSILLFTVSILPENFSWIAQIGIVYIRTYSSIPVFGLIIITLLLAIIRNKSFQKS